MLGSSHESVRRHILSRWEGNYDLGHCVLVFWLGQFDGRLGLQCYEIAGVVSK